MINKIILNNCVPYKLAELSDCSKVNFVFGANGSGKSTISSLLSGSTNLRFSQSAVEFDSDIHETVYVYNRSFRQNNFQQMFPGVFTMGSATIEEINSLEKMKEELTRKREELEKNLRTYKNYTEKLIPECEKRFKENAWLKIYKANNDDFKKAFEGLRNSKERFVFELKRRIDGIHGHKGTICERTNLKDRANTLYSVDSETCKRFVLDIEAWLNKADEIRNNTIWETVIAGNKDIDIAALIEKLDNSPWVDQGRQYLRHNSRICPFCQQETITNEFRDKLESFFDDEYKQRVEEMQRLLIEYVDITDHILSSISEVVLHETAINIGKIDVDVYLIKESLLRSLYSEHKNKMEEKIKEPGIKISFSDTVPILLDIFSIIDSANEKIDAHNKLVEEKETEEAKLTDDVWSTIIRDSDSLIKTYQTDIKKLKKAAYGIKTTCDSKKKEIDELESLIVEKGRLITSVQPAIDEINRSLKAYGFTNFSIQPAAEHENYYCIKRDDGSYANDTLSEGEETFLTFLYFMQWTKGSIDPEHVSDKKIIVLDDPISSLDSNILYIVGAMVKELSKNIRNGIGDVIQLFVLTHNVFFHKEASFIDGRTKEMGDVHYWIVHKDEGISTIKSYGTKNPISTTYELLWQELRDNENLALVSIQNTMRRILENYFGMLGKDKDATLIGYFSEPEDQMIARSLIAWINDGSHSIPDDLYIDAYTDAVPKYKEVFKRMFYESGHKEHYNMMMGISEE